MNAFFMRRAFTPTHFSSGKTDVSISRRRNCVEKCSFTLANFLRSGRCAIKMCQCKRGVSIYDWMTTVGVCVFNAVRTTNLRVDGFKVQIDGYRIMDSFVQLRYRGAGKCSCLDWNTTTNWTHGTTTTVINVLLGVPDTTIQSNPDTTNLIP